MLASLLERCMKRRGVKESDPFDWEKTDQQQIISNNSSQQQSNIQSTTNQQIRNDQLNGGGVITGGGGGITQMTVAGSNASGIEYVSK